MNRCQPKDIILIDRIFSVIRNFPGQRKLDTISQGGFSPKSGYMAIGSKRMQLFKLNHYPNY